jgi:hypothetical protein
MRRHFATVTTVGASLSTIRYPARSNARAVRDLHRFHLSTDRQSDSDIERRVGIDDEPYNLNWSEAIELCVYCVAAGQERRRKKEARVVRRHLPACAGSLAGYQDFDAAKHGSGLIDNSAAQCTPVPRLAVRGSGQKGQRRRARGDCSKDGWSCA